MGTLSDLPSLNVQSTILSIFTIWNKISVVNNLERGAQGSGGETWGKETIGEIQTQMGG